MSEVREEIVNRAVELYKDLNSDYGRAIGEYDKQGRYWVKEGFECEACEGIRRPSLAYPYSLYTHALSQKHTILFFKLDKTEIKKFKEMI